MKMLAGNGALTREALMTMVDVNCDVDEKGIHYEDEHEPDWYWIGDDNEDLTRERNDSVDSTKNVKGETNISTTLGAQTTEMDPFKIKGNDKLSAIIWAINKYDLKDDQATLHGMEVCLGEVESDGVYGAWTEDAVVSLGSFGGDTTAINIPPTLNWKGNKVHGTFSTSTKKFTKITEA